MSHIHANHQLPGRHKLDDALTPFEALSDALGLTLQGGCEGTLDSPEYFEGRAPAVLVFADTTKEAVADILKRGGITYVAMEARYNGEYLTLPKTIWELPEVLVLLHDAPTNPYNDFVVLNFHPDAVGAVFNGLASAV